MNRFKNDTFRDLIIIKIAIADGLVTNDLNTCSTEDDKLKRLVRTGNLLKHFRIIYCIELLNTPLVIFFYCNQAELFIRA